MDTSDPTVLVAYDGSAAARQAIIHAATLLRPCNLVIVTVWEPGLAYTAPLPASDPIMATPVDPELAHKIDTGLLTHAEAVSQAGAELAHSLGFTAEPVAAPDTGEISATILDLARSRNAAAIVVGSRGLTGLRARLEGSVSRAVLRHAPCPVIVVHEPD